MMTEKRRIYQRFFKRPLDLTLAILLLILTTPLMLLIAIRIRIELGPGVLFKQKRPGRNERIFTLYKFRTMTDAKDESGELLEDKDRLTKLGMFLRSTSLDELPELINILKGDMSLIGPRPLLIKYLPLYSEEQRRRHDVRPGLSGLAQVNGRNGIDWKEKFELDLNYVRNITLVGDLKILFQTIHKVLRRDGIHSDHECTMEEFHGNTPENNKNRQLIILGAGGHGRSVADIARRMKKWDQISFLDDDPSMSEAMGIPVIGRTSDASLYSKNAEFFVAIGNNPMRQSKTKELEVLGITPMVLIHPASVIGEQVTIATGTVIMAGAIINCCSKIGKGCIINTGATIDHDAVIEDYVHVSPGANLAGRVRIGTGSWLGIGSVVSNQLTITGGCVIGAGSVVIKDITEPGTYVGMPVRRI